MGQLNSVPELAPDLFAELLPEENTTRAWHEKRRSIVKKLYGHLLKKCHLRPIERRHPMFWWCWTKKTDNLRISNITSDTNVNMPAAESMWTKTARAMFEDEEIPQDLLPNEWPDDEQNNYIHLVKVSVDQNKRDGGTHTWFWWRIIIGTMFDCVLKTTNSVNWMQADTVKLMKNVHVFELLYHARRKYFSTFSRLGGGSIVVPSSTRWVVWPTNLVSDQQEYTNTYIQRVFSDETSGAAYPNWSDNRPPIDPFHNMYQYDIYLMSHETVTETVRGGGGTDDDEDVHADVLEGNPLGFDFTNDNWQGQHLTDGFEPMGTEFLGNWADQDNHVPLNSRMADDFLMSPSASIEKVPSDSLSRKSSFELFKQNRSLSISRDSSFKKNPSDSLHREPSFKSLKRDRSPSISKDSSPKRKKPLFDAMHNDSEAPVLASNRAVSITPKLQFVLKKSTVPGTNMYGLFAGHDFEHDECITLYDGFLYEWQQSRLCYPGYEENDDSNYAVQVKTNRGNPTTGAEWQWAVDAHTREPDDNYTPAKVRGKQPNRQPWLYAHFINHDKDKKNALFKQYGGVYTYIDESFPPPKEDDEIFLDYGWDPTKGSVCKKSGQPAAPPQDRGFPKQVHEELGVSGRNSFEKLLPGKWEHIKCPSFMPRNNDFPVIAFINRPTDIPENIVVRKVGPWSVAFIQDCSSFISVGDIERRKRKPPTGPKPPPTGPKPPTGPRGNGQKRRRPSLKLWNNDRLGTQQDIEEFFMHVLNHHLFRHVNDDTKENGLLDDEGGVLAQWMTPAFSLEGEGRPVTGGKTRYWHIQISINKSDVVNERIPFQKSFNDALMHENANYEGEFVDVQSHLVPTSISLSRNDPNWSEWFKNKDGDNINSWTQGAVLPSNMIFFEVKRFIYDKNDLPTKNQRPIDMPDVLPETNPFGGWELRAFTYHDGKNLNRGHYVTFVKHNSTWYIINNFNSSDDVKEFKKITGRGVMKGIDMQKRNGRLQETGLKTLRTIDDFRERGYFYLYTKPTNSGGPAWNVNPPQPTLKLGARSPSNTCFAAALMQMLRTLPRDLFAEIWAPAIFGEKGATTLPNGSAFFRIANGWSETDFEAVSKSKRRASKARKKNNKKAVVEGPPHAV